MESIGTGISNMLAQYGTELAAALRNAQNNDKLAVSVRKTWSDNPDAADYILAHINAMFFEKDSFPRKGFSSDAARYDLCVYVDESLANSELNARRELLVLMLAQEGIHFQNLNIRFAARSMKERHLYPKIIEELNQKNCSSQEYFPQKGTVSDESIAELAGKIESPLLSERFKTAMTVTVGDFSSQPDASNSWIGREGTDYQIKDESQLLHIIKRAFCQSFADYEQAGTVLDRVEGASLEEVSFSRISRSSKTRYRCHFYTSNPEELNTIISTYGGAIISQANKLNLYLVGFSIHESPKPIKGMHAFPRSGHPLPMRAYRLVQHDNTEKD